MGAVSAFKGEELPLPTHIHGIKTKGKEKSERGRKRGKIKRLLDFELHQAWNIEQKKRKLALAN